MSRILGSLHISTKLVSASIVGILFVAVMIVNQVLANGSVERGIAKAIDQQEIARLAVDVKADARRMQVAVRDLRLAKSEDDIRAGDDRLAAARKDADAIAEEMHRRSVSAENKARIAELRKQIDVYASAGGRVAANRHKNIVAVLAGRGDEITALDKEVADLARNVTLPTSAKVDEIAVEIAKFASSRAEAEKNDVRSLLASSALTSGIIGAAAILVLIGAALVSVFAVSRPIGTMVACMRAIAGGMLSVSVTDIERGDEIGDMARATQVFKDGLIETERLRARTGQGRSERRRAAEEGHG